MSIIRNSQDQLERTRSAGMIAAIVTALEYISLIGALSIKSFFLSNMSSVLQPFHDSITAELSALRQEIRSMSSELDTSGSSTEVTGEMTASVKDNMHQVRTSPSYLCIRLLLSVDTHLRTSSPLSTRIHTSTRT